MTKLKALLATAALVATPGLAVAQGCDYVKQQQAMTCAPGNSFDATAGVCTPDATG
ncbi:MAG: hypothetical protein WBA67_17690 [Jannaschia sp.]